MRRARIEDFHVLTNMDTAEVLTATWHYWSKFCQMSVATDWFFWTLQIHHHRMIDFQIRKCTPRTTILYNYFQRSDNIQTRWDTYSSWKFIKLLQKFGTFQKVYGKAALKILSHPSLSKYTLALRSPTPRVPSNPQPNLGLRILASELCSRSQTAIWTHLFPSPWILWRPETRACVRAVAWFMMTDHAWKAGSSARR